MSYSFTVKAVSKAAAKVAVAAQFDEAVRHQACHHRDRTQALAAANAFIDLLADDDSRDVSVSMSGHLAGSWQGSDVTRISTAAVSVQAGLADRPTAQIDEPAHAGRNTA